jgi:hypothetical protein
MFLLRIIIKKEKAKETNPSLSESPHQQSKKKPDKKKYIIFFVSKDKKEYG